MSKDYVVNLEAPPAIVERDTTRADTVRQRLQQIDSSVTVSYFEQIDLLAEVNHNNYWDGWKFESFKDYVKKSGFDLTMAEVEKGIRISTVSEVLDINKVSLARAKKTKVGIIFELDHTKVVTDPATQKEEKLSDVIVKLVADAPSKTVIELREIVKGLKALYATEDDLAGDLVWMNNPVRRDAKQIVDAAIEKIMKFNGCTIDIMTKEEKNISKAAAIEKMAADILADPNYDVDEDGEEGTFEDTVEDSDLEGYDAGDSEGVEEDTD